MADLKLYKLLHETMDGDNKDLMVIAADPQQAYELWGKRWIGNDWTDDHDERVEWTYLTDELVLVEDPTAIIESDEGWDPELRIFEVHLDMSEPKALGWYEDLVPVAFMLERS